MNRYPRLSAVSSRAAPAETVRRAPGVPAPTWKPRAVGHPPRVLVVADVPNWAWARKAAALKQHLAGRIEVTVVHSTEQTANGVIRRAAHDLYHTFEVCQVGAIPVGWPMTTGITAHVIKTWELKRPGSVREWADRAVGFHANSKLLQRELEGFLGRSIYYVPNGVDETFFRRARPRETRKLVVGYVARPNVRKGPEIVEEACKRAGVELRAIVRTWKTALTAVEMRDWYQDIHVLAVSSDMDGTPNPALEAAACECAVVSNAIGNMPEFISHGANGYLTERTVESLAQHLSFLASLPITDVEMMGRAARATVLAGWTWRQRSIAYAEMWERCLGVQRAEASR
jgi:glycosyltransferase involved in cell wall biosynthesis